MNLHESEDLQRLIEGCRENNRRAQHLLFKYSYSYAMSICARFTASRDEASEVLNEGFLKVFTQLDKYTSSLSFAGWMRKIMINTSIDHYRRHKRFSDRHLDMTHIKEMPEENDLISRISADELIGMIQKLPPAYRMVFTLHAVEEYTHKEIAEQLGITEGTSKSNFAKARLKLKKTLESINKSLDQTYG